MNKLFIDISYVSQNTLFLNSNRASTHNDISMILLCPTKKARPLLKMKLSTWKPNHLKDEDLGPIGLKYVFVQRV